MSVRDSELVLFKKLNISAILSMFTAVVFFYTNVEIYHR